LGPRASGPNRPRYLRGKQNRAFGSSLRAFTATTNAQTGILQAVGKKFYSWECFWVLPWVAHPACRGIVDATPAEGAPPFPPFWRQSGSSCSNYNLPGAPCFRVLCEIVEARDLDSKLPVPNGTGPKFPPLQTAQGRGTRSRLIR